MTETSTQTWHELAEQNHDLQDAIDSALEEYVHGRDIHLIMLDLKQSRTEILGEAAE